MLYPELKRQVTEQAALYSPETILIEDKVSGTSLIQEMIHDGMSHIHPFSPAPCDKITRLNTQSDAFENGRILLPSEAHWLEDYRDELTGFPGCTHDDQVDSTVQALAFLCTLSAADAWIQYMKNRAAQAHEG